MYIDILYSAVTHMIENASLHVPFIKWLANSLIALAHNQVHRREVCAFDARLQTRRPVQAMVRQTECNSESSLTIWTRVWNVLVLFVKNTTWVMTLSISKMFTVSSGSSLFSTHKRLNPLCRFTIQRARPFTRRSSRSSRVPHCLITHAMYSCTHACMHTYNGR